MESVPTSELTSVLHRLRSAGPDRRELWGLVFEAAHPALRRVAKALMRSESPGHTLSPTALINEVYLKLVDSSQADWRDRAHFLGVAAHAMREILVDHARRRRAAKRGGGWVRMTFDDALCGSRGKELELIGLDSALRRLADLNERMARVVELKVFGGLTYKEIAHVLGVSVRTAAGDWAVARLWLARELNASTLR